MFMIVSIPLIATIISILACFYGSYSDIKRGIIPNKLTFPLIGLGIVLNGIYAYNIGNIWYFVGAVIVTAVIFALGYLFWKMGAWAGGDVKLFTALAALIPFYPIFLSFTVFGVQFPIYASYPFPFTLIINSILSMLPFLLIYVFYVALKNKPHLLNELFSPVRDYRKNIVMSLVVTSAGTLTLFVIPYLPSQFVIIISLILVFLLSFVISKLPDKVKAVLVAAVTLFALYQNVQITITGIIIIFITITFVEIMRKLLTSVSREALQDDYKLDDLEEGMIPAYGLYELDGEVFLDDKGFFQKFKEAVQTGNISGFSTPKGKLLISSLAKGLEKEDIDLLKKLSKEGKIEDSFRIKKGVPFAPSILIGLLISLFIGDLAFIFLKILSGIMYK